MSEQELYRIGTVSKLSGVSPECLRAWERRYQLKPAQKNGKTRFYSHQQVQDLKRFKSLIEQGHPISSLAHLSSTQLNARITSESYKSSALESVNTHIGALPLLGLIGTNLLMLEQDSVKSDRIEVTQRWHSAAEYLNSRPSELNNLSAVALSAPNLNLQEIGEIRARAPEIKLLVVYQYARPERITELEHAGIPVLEWPTSWENLVASCLRPGDSHSTSSKSSPRRYNDSQLLSIASSAKQKGVEAPRHLVTLINSLNAYEQYTLEQVSDSPENAPLNSRICEDVSFARAQLERSLGDLAVHCELAVPDCY